MRFTTMLSSFSLAMILASTLAYGDDTVEVSTVASTKLSSMNILDQINVVSEVQERLSLELQSQRREHAAQCVERESSAAILARTLNDYGDLARQAALTKGKVQTLVAMKLLTACAAISA